MFSETYCQAKGLEIVSKHFFLFKCLTCGQIIAPEFNNIGQLPKDWWKCPNGCNKDNVLGGEV